MKKWVRLMACVSALVLMCTSFCGCHALDELRSNHAVYKDNDTILWNGDEYKLLPACMAFTPTNDYSDMVFVTASDVPTLLSAFFGDNAYVCNDGMILECDKSSMVDRITAEDVFMDYATVYYCLAEEFDRIKDEIDKANAGALEYNTYSYSFGEYDETTEWYETRTRILTESEKDTFATAVTTAPLITDGVYDWQMEFIVDVATSTKDLLFYGSEFYGVYRFTVSTAGTSYFVWDYMTEEYYAIDKAYTAAFNEMLDPAIKAMEESAWTEDGYELVF